MLMHFLETGRDTGLALPASYDAVLVGCSIAVPVLATYATLGIPGQVRAARGLAARLMWLTNGAIALGLGIWTMHFTAMLAYRLPITVRYDILPTALSVLPAIGAAAIALYQISQPMVRTRNIVLGGLLIGAGIGTMHYTGMAAMQVQAEMLYSSYRVVVSVIVAAGLGMLSLYTYHALSEGVGTGSRWRWARPLSALIMGAAISGMHYTAMAAVYFFPIPESAIAATGAIFDARGLATSVLFSSGVLILLLLVTTHEVELSAKTLAVEVIQRQNTLLDAAVRERTHQLVNANAVALQSLERRVAERTAALEARQRQSVDIAELTALLLATEDVEDAAGFLPRMLGKLLAPQSGALYLFSSSRDHLDSRGQFGAASECAQSVEPSECWALRRSQVYGAFDPARDIFCLHVAPQAAPSGYVCVPMQARGAPIGLLHVAFAARLTPEEHAQTQEHIEHVAEQVSVGLSNLKLREALRRQSIHDELTGLFNRRYMEESLKREIVRAKRGGQSLALLLMDVDHLKSINDAHGHEAGDAVLRALGRLFKDNSCAEDLICRFSSQEFTAALPGATSEQAREWAEQLMNRVRAMTVQAGGRTLPGVTISVGLACHPEHGEDFEALLQAADLALADAKHAGRDRLVVSSKASGGGIRD